jgi:hypothetical protein
VHAIGDFEYKYVLCIDFLLTFFSADRLCAGCSYIWNAAQNASLYNSLTFGVMFGELAQNFVAFKEGKETFKARLYVGHDGSMVLSFL